MRLSTPTALQCPRSEQCNFKPTGVIGSQCELSALGKYMSPPIRMMWPFLAKLSLEASCSKKSKRVRSLSFFRLPRKLCFPYHILLANHNHVRGSVWKPLCFQVFHCSLLRSKGEKENVLCLSKQYSVCFYVLSDRRHSCLQTIVMSCLFFICVVPRGIDLNEHSSLLS